MTSRGQPRGQNAGCSQRDDALGGNPPRRVDIVEPLTRQPLAGQGDVPPAARAGAGTEGALNLVFNNCQTPRYRRPVPTSIGFRPTPEDERILREAGRPGESTTDTLRRALRLLDHDRWLQQFHA